MWMGVLPRKCRGFVIKAMSEVSEDALSPFHVKVATTTSEVLGACKVLHDAYAGRGIAERHPSGLRVGPHWMLPTATILVAKRGCEVVGTLALFGRSALGLPSEGVLGNSVGGVHAEIGGVSVQREFRGRGIPYLLYKLMSRMSQDLLGYRRLVAVFHPKARFIYETMGFQRVGVINEYPGLQNAPGLAMILDLDEARREALASPRRARQSATCARSYLVEPLEAQIQFPTTDELAEGFKARLDAAPKLTTDRRDIFLATTKQVRDALRAEVPMLRAILPTLSQGAS